jgi:ATP-dependent DNA helicase PIF1
MSNFLKKIFPIGQLRSCGQFDVPENLNIAMRLLTDNCILTPTNAQVRILNSMLLERVSGQEMIFEASDEPGGGLQLDRANMMHRSLIKRMNAYRNSCFPDPIIQLKVGAPVMLIRNLSPAEGLVNGTRLIVTDITTVDNAKCVECIILNGVSTGKKALFHRIDFHHDFEDSCPIDFVCRQFPLHLCFAMTINKSQGQTFSSRVGIYLKQGIFDQGHLYVALSRGCSHAPMAKRGQHELRKVVAAEVTALIRHNSATADPST